MNTKKKFSDYLSENMENISNIMDNVESILTENNINYLTNASNTEIVVKDSTKKEVISLINSLPIANMLLCMILDISSTKGKVYIRKKMK